MRRSKYQKIGLRADKNLKDVTNPYSALQNILDDLSPSVFIPEDLTDAINGIRNTNLTQEDFLELIGAVQKYTPLNETTPLNITPFVTIEDKLNNAKIILEEPPLYSGGPGPNAYKIPGSSLVSQNTITASTKGDELFTPGNEIGPISFWDAGFFEIPIFIDSTFGETYGGLQWEGYLSCNRNILQAETSGLLLIEEDVFDDGNWETIKSIYDTERDVVFLSESFNTTTVSSEHIKNIAIGDTFVHNLVTHTVIDIDYSTNTIVVDRILDNVSLGVPYTLTTPELGINTYTIGNLPRYQSFFEDRIKTRITLWWPEPTDPTNSYRNKSLIMSQDGNFRLTYLQWYKDPFVSPRDAKQFSYRHRKENSITQLKKDLRYSIEVQNSVTSNYVPPKTMTEVLSSEAVFTYEGKGKITADTPGVFSSGDGSHIIIKDASENRFSYTIRQTNDNTIAYIDDSANLTIGDTYNGYVAANLGLLGIYAISNSTISDVAGNFQNSFRLPKQLLIAHVSETSIPVDLYKLDSYNPNTSSISVSDLDNGPVALADEGFVLVYANRGILDNTNYDYCIGTFAKEVITAANTGSNIIEITSTDDITVTPRIYVQYGNESGNTSYNSSIIDDGVYVSAILSNTEIQLSDTLNGNIPAAATITMIEEQNWSANSAKELCVFPLNTEFPFEETLVGLKTTVSFPNLTANIIETGELKLVTNTANIDTVLSNTSYSETYPIEFNGNTYKLLIR